MLNKKTRKNLEKIQRKVARKLKKYRREEDVMEGQREKMKDAAQKLYEGETKEKKGRSKEVYNLLQKQINSDDMNVTEVHYDEDMAERLWNAEIKKGIKNGKLDIPDTKKDKFLQ